MPLNSIDTIKQDLHADDEAVRNARANPENFRLLYEKYYRQIFLFVLHRVGEKETTADITSQVFLNAFVNLEKFRFKGLPFSSWLYRISINECNSFFKKNKKERQVILNNSLAEELYEEMFNEDMLDELKLILPTILEKLKPNDFQFIELRYLEGMSFREMAEILDITESHARVKTYRSLEKLRKLFLK